MADDIEEFLKRVAEKRRAQQGGRPASQQPRPPQQQQPQPPPQKRKQQPRPAPPPPVVQAPPVIAEPASVYGEEQRRHGASQDLEQHAKSFLNREEFEKKKRSLGELQPHELPHLQSSLAKSRPAPTGVSKTAQAARQVEERARKKAAAEAAELEGLSLAEILKSPPAFRSAYLFSLVFERPAWKEMD